MDLILEPRPLPMPAALAGAEPEASVDLLTGLATRRTLIQRMAELMQPGPTPSPLVLILLDLDRFKAVNDGLGPKVGDALLRRIADRLRRTVTSAAILARVSGDGFAVLVADVGEVAELAAELLDFLGRPYAVQGHAVTVGLSLGIARADAHGADPVALLHAADLAMHEAEREGRNRIRWFEPPMLQRASARQALESDLRAAMAFQQVELRRALVSEQFEVHYQPQHRIGDGRLTGLEALLRWRHPERGLVPPGAFVSLAEEIGLIELLGDWVLRVACRQAAAWPAAPDGTRPRVAVNVSPLQLRDGRAFLDGLDRALREAGLPPERLELEVTETALAEEIGATLRAIRARGVGLALDDFGTGYSSLSRLRHHAFERLKIDRSFVVDLDEAGDPARRDAAAWMIRAVASLGRGLGLDTVIEGIETPAQLEVARGAGCTEVQGYLFGPPVPAGQVEALITGASTPLATKDPS